MHSNDFYSMSPCLHSHLSQLRRVSRRLIARRWVARIAFWQQNLCKHACKDLRKIYKDHQRSRSCREKEGRSHKSSKFWLNAIAKICKGLAAVLHSNLEEASGNDQSRRFQHVCQDVSTFNTFQHVLAWLIPQLQCQRKARDTLRDEMCMLKFMTCVKGCLSFRRIVSSWRRIACAKH